MMLRQVSDVGLRSCDVTSSWLYDQSLTSFTVLSAAGRQRVGGVILTDRQDSVMSSPTLKVLVEVCII